MTTIDNSAQLLHCETEDHQKTNNYTNYVNIGLKALSSGALIAILIWGITTKTLTADQTAILNGTIEILQTLSGTP
jgi:hypothetical protein